MSISENFRGQVTQKGRFRLPDPFYRVRLEISLGKHMLCSEVDFTTSIDPTGLQKKRFACQGVKSLYKFKV